MFRQSQCLGSRVSLEANSKDESSKLAQWSKFMMFQRVEEVPS